MVFVAEGAFLRETIRQLLMGTQDPISANTTLDANKGRRYVITKATAATITLPAPTVGDSDGLRIEILSNTAAAHVINSTGNFQDGAGHVNTATMAAQKGACLILEAYQGKWNVTVAQGVTMS